MKKSGCDAKNAQIRNFRAQRLCCGRDPLGEFVALPRHPSCIGEGGEGKRGRDGRFRPKN